jgi:hypothetical protein
MPSVGIEACEDSVRYGTEGGTESDIKQRDIAETEGILPSGTR